MGKLTPPTPNPAGNPDKEVIMKVRSITSNGKKRFVDLVYSPDDGGYYCEIWDENGATVGHTSTCATEQDALSEAKSIVLMDCAV